MKAAVLHAKSDIRYEEVETPKAGPDEVLVRVGAVGICGSDIPRVLGNAAHYYPVILGHEFAGEVVELGSSVTTVRVGDRVAVAPLVPCMACADCQRGDYSLCRSYTFIGSRDPGAFAEYVRVPTRNLVPLPEGVDDIRGAFFEPSTVALHGLRVADYRPGEHVLVLGAGTVGAFAVQWAKILGARSVTVLDINANRLAVASRLGADAVLDSRDPGVVEQALALTDGKGFGYVLETAGKNATMALSFQLVAGKGTVCFIGTSSTDVAFEHKLFEQLNRKEFRLTGSWMSYSAPFPGEEWTATADYFARGLLRLDADLLHGTFPLSAAAEVFTLFATPGAVTGKVMFLPPAGIRHVLTHPLLQEGPPCPPSRQLPTPSTRMQYRSVRCAPGTPSPDSASAPSVLTGSAARTSPQPSAMPCAADTGSSTAPPSTSTSTSLVTCSQRPSPVASPARTCS